MNKLTIAAAGALLSACLLAGPAQAMPASNLAQAAQEVANAQSVGWACNPWGRCRWRPNYYYYSYAPPVVVVSPGIWREPIYAYSLVVPNWWGYGPRWHGRRAWPGERGFMIYN